MPPTADPDRWLPACRSDCGFLYQRLVLWAMRDTLRQPPLATPQPQPSNPAQRRPHPLSPTPTRLAPIR